MKTLRDIYEDVINTLYGIYGDQAMYFNVYPDWYDGDTAGNVVVNGKSYLIDSDITDDDFDSLIETITEDIDEKLPKSEKEEIEEDLGNEVTEQSDVVEDAGNTAVADDYPALLVALDSERDAEVTYKTLIEIEESAENPRQDVIELLKKILSDEMEHIALLSALQADKASSFVGEDSKEEFSEIIDNIQ